MMNNYQLSFAKIKLLTQNLAELVVNKDTEITLEMIEELDKFYTKTFNQNFAVLINKLNQFAYSFEAKCMVGLHKNLAAVAVVSYDDIKKDVTNEILKLRAIDNLNIKIFSGLELGWQQALQWLNTQLDEVDINTASPYNKLQRT